MRHLFANADELPARECPQFAERGSETWRRVPGRKVVEVDAVFGQQRCRQIKLPPRDVKRMTRLFCDKIETVDPGFGIEVMTLAATVTEPLLPKPTAVTRKEARRQG